MHIIKNTTANASEMKRQIIMYFQNMKTKRQCLMWDKGRFNIFEIL